MQNERKNDENGKNGVSGASLMCEREREDKAENGTSLSGIERTVERELAKEVTEDYERRREERRSLEQQWKLNLNYLMGNQYAEIAPTGEIDEEEKDYFWQGRNVFNHIAPIIETRIAKLSRVRPIMSVRASGEDERDLKAAKMASALLSSTFSRLEMSDVIYKATLWSETLGTSFYKVTWDYEGGKRLGGTEGGKPVYEGDVKVEALSPFDVYPDSLFKEDVDDQKSIIHARAMSVDDVAAIYGKRLKGGEIDVFSMERNGIGSTCGVSKRLTSGTLRDSVVVIERYEKPSEKYPNGRVVTVAEGEVLAVGELPYVNGEEDRRVFPFVRQVSVNQTGCFFGVSVIDRLIPVQRAYNAVKNRKHEYLNRVSMGVVTVEDGSVDTDALVEDGLSPGKVLVYRQGSTPPRFMASASVPPDFSYEESRLEQEFKNISGVSEFSRNSDLFNSNMSGVALELVVEQDETRLITTAENVRRAVRIIGKQIIRLFRQFAKPARMMRVAGHGNSVELYYFNSDDLTSDDVVFDTENELSYSPAQKKSAVYDMLKAGLLSDDDGKMNQRTKAKILELLGFGTLYGAQDITNLHIDKAQRENIFFSEKDCEPEEFDDHALHITEHTRFLLSEDFDGKEKIKERIVLHVRKHKLMLAGGDALAGNALAENFAAENFGGMESNGGEKAIGKSVDGAVSSGKPLAD